MSGIKYFPQDLNLENKTIILRVDLNVPIVEKKIQDFTRISLILPFIIILSLCFIYTYNPML